MLRASGILSSPSTLSRVFSFSLPSPARRRWLELLPTPSVSAGKEASVVTPYEWTANSTGHLHSHGQGFQVPALENLMWELVVRQAANTKTCQAWIHYTEKGGFYRMTFYQRPFENVI